MIFLDQMHKLATTGRSGEIKPVTKEEVHSLGKEDLLVLHRILVAPHVALALMGMQRAGFFLDLIPEIQESLALKSSKHFKEIWPHTLRVINQTPPTLTLRWSALFHDLGKAKAFSIKNDKVTFHHHEKISAKIFNSFAKETKIFSPGQKNCIYCLVSNLGYIEGYDNSWTDSAVRRFAKEIGPYLNDLLILSEADITTANPQRRSKIINKINNLRQRISDIAVQDAKRSGLPKGLGNEISEALGIPIGPRIGELRNILETKIESGELLPDREFQYYIGYLREMM